MTWSSRKNCRVTPNHWFASSSQMKFHIFPTSFMLWNGTQNPMKWRLINYKTVTNKCCFSTFDCRLPISEFLWKKFPFHLCLSLSVISTNLAQRCCKRMLPCLSHAQQMKMTRDKHVLGIGLKSCGMLVFWWIWMLSFLLNQIWIGIGDTLLNIFFFTTFGPVLRLQVALLIRVPQIRWDYLCLCKCWSFSITSEISLFYCISCHQTYRTGWTFIGPIPFHDSSL